MGRAAAILHVCAIALAALSGCATKPMTVEVRSTGFVTSDAVRLNVLEAGAQHSGPLVLFIPGWSMPASIWQRQLEAVGDKHRTAALDPRGQGASDIPSTGYNIERRAADLNDFIQRQGRVVLVGWSLGALEVLQYVHRYGEDAVEAIVLVDSSVGEDPPPPSGGGFIESLKADRRAATEEFVRDMFRTWRPGGELAALTSAAMRMPLESSLSLFPRGYPREHWRVIARAISRPLLYVVTPSFAEQAAALQANRPGTRIAVFQDAGHALFVDEPDRFNKLLADFLRELPVLGGRIKVVK